jgi:hypothetical protein
VETRDEEAELAKQFVSELQGAKMRDELAKRRFKEASLQTQVDDLSDEVRRLEKEVKNKDVIMEACVDRLHEQEMRLGRLQREKEEAEEILEVAAETIRETRAQVQLLEERKSRSNVWDSVRCLVGRGSREVNEKKIAMMAEEEEAVIFPSWASFRLPLLLLILSIAVMYLTNGSQFLPFHPLHRYDSRASNLPALLPGGRALESGEYLSSCRHPWLFAAGLGGRSEGDGCTNPHFLWMQEDGLLVLYRGWSPSQHGGPVWATHPVDVTTVAGSRTMKKLRGGEDKRHVAGEGSPRRIVRALVERDVLKLVRVLEGSGAEVVVFSMALSKLPAVLSPWPFARVSKKTMF